MGGPAAGAAGPGTVGGAPGAGHRARRPAATVATARRRVRPPVPRAAAGEYRRPVGPVLNQAAPVRLTIPDLRISTGIMRLGLQDDGTMEVPRSAGRAGWYERSPTPGALGPAVVAGHVTWDRKPDVFFELGRLKPGQRVDVARADGSTAVFEVTKVERYAKRDFPTEEVYGTADHAGLRLITCGGVFDAASGHYLDNVIAFARLVGSRAA